MIYVYTGIYLYTGMYWFTDLYVYMIYVRVYTTMYKHTKYSVGYRSPKPVPVTVSVLI